MSGFFGQIMGSGVLGNLGGLSGLLTQVVGSAQGAAGGGLPALLQQFETAGLGTQVQSWIGGGENHPITAEHVTQAIPAETLQEWATRAGIPAETLARVLAEVLPHAIDHATPDGVVPPVPTGDFSGVVGRLFGR